MSEHLSLRSEADRIERTARRNLAQARLELRALLNRPMQTMEGEERKLALDFNARLCTLLRERGVRLWGDA